MGPAVDRARLRREGHLDRALVRYVAREARHLRDYNDLSRGVRRQARKDHGGRCATCTFKPYRAARRIRSTSAFVIMFFTGSEDYVLEMLWDVTQHNEGRKGELVSATSRCKTKHAQELILCPTSIINVIHLRTECWRNVG
jgi:hypothetical protein